MQKNGYDCGVYVLKFIELILSTFPQSTASNISGRFSADIHPTSFMNFDIDNLRDEMKITAQKYGEIVYHVV